MRTVLLAEDETFVAGFYKKTLESHGVAVSIVSNGEEALQAIKTQHFDLLLLDLLMPVMDGYQVLAQLKKDKIRIPVTVVLTNLSQPVTKEECKALGAEDYIVKSDSDAEDVWEKVEKYLPHEGG
ncbi:MAG: hypothetical protein Greene041619_824 [Candidatus Peregrinibacteria bacterium Greene0416_19]|nr:MAG: hypothetical protein Greene041619_824 [Candidatus Peregrinibacteria bacterium Greene0416_19]